MSHLLQRQTGNFDPSPALKRTELSSQKVHTRIAPSAVNASKPPSSSSLNIFSSGPQEKVVIQEAIAPPSSSVIIRRADQQSFSRQQSKRFAAGNSFASITSDSSPEYKNQPKRPVSVNATIEKSFIENQDDPFLPQMSTAQSTLAEENKAAFFISQQVQNENSLSIVDFKDQKKSTAFDGNDSNQTVISPERQKVNGVV
jgi:hypothetical protein